MTTLDQAFFKAYSQSARPSAVEPPRDATVESVRRDPCPGPLLRGEGASLRLAAVESPPAQPPTTAVATEPCEAEGKESPSGPSECDAPGMAGAVLAAFQRPQHAGTLRQPPTSPDEHGVAEAEATAASPDSTAACTESRGEAARPYAAVADGAVPAVDALGIPGLSRRQAETPEANEATSAEEGGAGEPDGDLSPASPSEREEHHDRRYAPAAPVTVFQPVLQVERFAPTEASARLSAVAAEALDRLANAIVAMAGGGRQVVALAGTRRGVGCTTVIVLLAQRLARRGHRIVVLEADPSDPHLARRMGVLVETGWEAAAAGRLPLAEILIESIDDGWTLLPWRPESDPEADPADVVADLRRGFEVVLVDWGAAADRLPESGWIDAALVVDDARDGSTGRSVVPLLEAAGIAVLGGVANFVRD